MWPRILVGKMGHHRMVLYQVSSESLEWAANWGPLALHRKASKNYWETHSIDRIGFISDSEREPEGWGYSFLWVESFQRLTILKRGLGFPGIEATPTFWSFLVDLWTLLAPMGFLAHAKHLHCTYTKAQGLLGTKYSTILGLVASN